MADCVFCKIIKGELPSYKIYEDEKVLVFLDINPVADGHVLLIPKEHYQIMPDVPDDLLAYAFLKAKELMPKIKSAMQVNYISISVVGMDVPHFHIHIIPRKFNDGLANFWPTKKYQEGEVEKIAKLITNNIKT
ncbi:HIT family protein [Candidatus Falkowbacteria bacterium CG10_big_fil_rev_8_21_14_0_10_43_11]|uniref:HIT family protein n=1 Tax=Candidatus Falkowbacteria bacterium CG10_big_fil_rev_8_21_14_0_10_43_11 TaxID=1974568 RepID=A0A2M6WLL8_9BACT|nr:MAG: HIT family protein [Candidatus Falkowbacteria bacterium CG10_big_fil_rev_8_21_14_0_10_43_11]